MDKNKDFTVKEAFKLAVENHKKNNLKQAQDLYNQVLKITIINKNKQYCLAVN